ncbi:AAA family ATPase [Brachybacterium huguangmaarense]
MHDASTHGPVLYVTIGLPGVGKTTAAREIAARERCLRLTPDEWMAPLFGDHDAHGRRGVLEGRMIDAAHQVLTGGASVVLDFGCWSPEERWALRAIAAGAGARCELVVPEASETERRRRCADRWRTAPSTTFPISETDHDLYATQYVPPGPAERAGALLPSSPAGTASWGAWAAGRWPSLPVLPTPR